MFELHNFRNVLKVKRDLLFIIMKAVFTKKWYQTTYYSNFTDVCKVLKHREF